MIRPAAYISAPTEITRKAAEPVGDRAGKRLAHSPQQILDRQRETEHVAAPGKFAAHRLHEKAEGRARPECQHADQAAAHHDHQRRPPGRCSGRQDAARLQSRPCQFLDGWCGSHEGCRRARCENRRQIDAWPKLMHRHGNPNGDIGKTFRRNAALQITAGSCDDLTVWAAGEATGCMLYLICSL